MSLSQKIFKFYCTIGLSKPEPKWSFIIKCKGDITKEMTNRKIDNKMIKGIKTFSGNCSANKFISVAGGAHVVPHGLA